ncbi:MAG: hypothetical protein Q4A84_05335 [Neisseria sp.]|uniref:hypothetical protein n=1 Tax=Neisseria sp. TaxID=192066 RepID=UPI0026DB60CC|nr:hypothetical protein [Neisseria sp.]MDO4641111.1 hypothetical protein [Neisseria sp.]
MFKNARDNIEFINKETNEKLVFHRRTWLCSIFGILTHYLRYTSDYAQKMIQDSTLCSETGLDFYSAAMLCHEDEYHWAMIIAHGESYWTKNFNPELPEDYDDWLMNYKNKYNLKLNICD